MVRPRNRASVSVAPARGDEGGNVGDGIPNPVATRASLQMERLIEVTCSGWVDGDERDVPEIPLGKSRHGRLSLGEDLWREGRGDLAFLPDQLETSLHHRIGGCEMELA
jgi:hypothetical protein